MFISCLYIVINCQHLCAYVETSSKMSVNVTTLFETAIRKVKPSYHRILFVKLFAPTSNSF
jgi:hypothetical protein